MAMMNKVVVQRNAREADGDQPKLRRGHSGSRGEKFSAAQVVLMFTALLAMCVWGGGYYYVHSQRHHHELLRDREFLTWGGGSGGVDVIQEQEEFGSSSGRRWGDKWKLGMQGDTTPRPTWDPARADLDEEVEAWVREFRRTYNASGTEPANAVPPGYHLGELIADPPYPFQRIQMEDGSDAGVIALIAPFYNDTYYKAESSRALFWRLRARGHIMLGISSYQDFPQQVLNPTDDRHTWPEHDWELYSHMDGWLHCFRDPDYYIPKGVPRILLSESDFHDPDQDDDGGSLVPKGREKKWDLVHSNLGSDWNDWNRNWTVCRASILELARAMPTMKIGIVGRNMTDDPDLLPLIQRGTLETIPEVEWKGFLQVIEQSRVWFVPNVYDGSPRVVVEALSLNVPVLMNYHILGGWKYVNNQTGMFFHDETDVVQAYQTLVSPEYQKGLRPRDWYKENWGYKKAVLQLKGFLELTVGTERLEKAQAVVNSFGVNGMWGWI